MNYKRMTNDELNKCKYPNLIAEIIESGYRTSTLADFMGLGSKKNGSYRKEGDPEVWDKINGNEEICASHIVGLCRYYGVSIEYLFSSELHVINDKPAAYWRWYDQNKKEEKELERIHSISKIYDTLKAKPYLIEFMKDVINYIELRTDKADDAIEEIENLTNELRKHIA